MPIFLECMSPDLLALIEDISMTSSTKHFLSLVPPCKKHDLQLKAGGMPKGMKIEKDEEKDSKPSKKKRKKSAYNVFIGECVKERSPTTPVSEQMKSCGPRWKGLPEETKNKYKALAQE